MNVPHEVWQATRYLNFGILVIAWFVMIYRGVNVWTKYKHSFNWARFTNLMWTSLALYSIIEVLFYNTNGGFRVLLQTVVALLQAFVAIFRFETDDDLKYRQLPQRLIITKDTNEL